MVLFARTELTVGSNLRQTCSAASSCEAGKAAPKDAIDAHAITPGQLQVMLQKLRWSPYEFQVHMMASEDAMKVWRIASPQERNQITAALAAKILASKTASKTNQVQWLRELRAGSVRPANSR